MVKSNKHKFVIYLSSIQLDWDSREPAEDENSSGRIKYRPDKEQQKVTFF